MNPNSYIISAALRSGIYRHIQINNAATLLDLHMAISSAFDINIADRPSFTPIKSTPGKPSVSYSLNNTKNTVAIGEVKLSDTEFSGKTGMLYTLNNPQVTLSCRTIKTLNEPTPEPKVVRASGSSFRFMQSMDTLIRTLQAKGLPPENLQVLEETASLTKEQRNFVIEYYLAASNLYGIVPIITIHDMYCRNCSPISLYSFTMFGIVMSWRENCRFVILDKEGKVLDKENYKKREAEYIVEYTVTEGGAFQAVLAMQAGKPYYQPSETEFLRYARIDYFERNEHSLRLGAHLQSLGLNQEDTNDCLRDILDNIRFSDFDTQELFDIINGYGVQLKNLNAIRQMMDLLVKMNNNTRTHLNCGHTPEEIGNLKYIPQKEASKKSNTSGNPLLSRLGVDPAKNKTDLKTGNLIPFPPLRQATQKPRRNDPCPCGSGKKYKHCCARS